MTKFAKLFELDQDEQVLLTLDYNEENKMYVVNVRTDINNVSAVIGLSFEYHNHALSALNKFSKDHAIKFRKNVIATIE